MFWIVLLPITFTAMMTLIVLAGKSVLKDFKFAYVALSIFFINFIIVYLGAALATSEKDLRGLRGEIYYQKDLLNNLKDKTITYDSFCYKEIKKTELLIENYNNRIYNIKLFKNKFFANDFSRFDLTPYQPINKQNFFKGVLK